MENQCSEENENYQELNSGPFTWPFFGQDPGLIMPVSLEQEQSWL